MGRPATSDSTLNGMIDALAWSRTALAGASEMEIDLTPERAAAFVAQAELLGPHAAAADAASRELAAFDRGPGLLAKVKVALGDVVLDRTVRWGNRLGKAELVGKAGLGIDHVFGRRVDELVTEKLELEPEAVARAAGRLNDLPEFPSRAQIRAKLTDAAERQNEALQSRRDTQRQRDTIESRHRLVIHAASEALAALEAELLRHFPRQYDYVGTFFAPTRRPSRRPAESTDTTETTDSHAG